MLDSVRLLTVCGTYRRPGLLLQMLGSFDETKSKGTEIVIYLSKDDPELESYKQNLSNRYHYIVGPHRYFAEAINHVVMEQYPGIPYYQAVNDDHIYRTNRWDDLLIAALEEKALGIGWAFGNDMVNNGEINSCLHPSSEVFSWRFVRALGYVYPKRFRQYGVDVWARRLLTAIGGLVYVPEVKIEHLCAWATGKIKVDQNGRDANTFEMHEYGWEVINEWIKNQEKDTIIRTLEARHEEQIARG